MPSKIQQVKTYTSASFTSASFKLHKIVFKLCPFFAGYFVYSFPDLHRIFPSEVSRGCHGWIWYLLGIWSDAHRPGRFSSTQLEAHADVCSQSRPHHSALFMVCTPGRWYAPSGAKACELVGFMVLGISTDVFYNYCNQITMTQIWEILFCHLLL